MLNDSQFSAYDERPDPKRPGQQGVLFRNVAPAQSDELRYGKKSDEYGHRVVTRAQDRGAVHDVPSDLFHGTTARLKPGSLIKPGKPGNYPTVNDQVVGLHGRTQDVNHEHVFAAENLHDAYRFSRIAQEAKGARAAHVYRVQPTGPVQADHEDVDYRGGYYDEPSIGSYQSKHPLRVLNEVQFSDAKESWRSYNEDDLGENPGQYEFAEKTPRQRWMEKYG